MGTRRNFCTVLYRIYVSLIVVALLCGNSSNNYLKFYSRKQVFYLENVPHFLFFFFFPFIILSLLAHQMVVLSHSPRAIYLCMTAVAGSQGCKLENVRMTNSSCLGNSRITLDNNYHWEWNG